MKFYINKIIVWKKDNDQKIIPFLPNKVNVVTGGPNTGITTIMKIIDYCLFASNSDIPDTINQDVLVYGLNITFNQNNYSIFRKASSKNNPQYSDEYYFLENDILLTNLESLNKYSKKEKELKNILRKEYVGITEDFELRPVGKIRDGHKLKIDYLFLFNTISQKIIMDSSDYFDFNLNKRNSELYKDFLTSFFDFSIDNLTEEYHIQNKTIQKIQKNIGETEGKINKEETIIRENTEFIKLLIFKSREYDLIDDEIDFDNIEEAFSILKTRINHYELKARSIKTAG